MVWLGGAPASRPQIKEEHDGAPGVAQETIICPKCKQQMLEGFIPDRFDHLTAVAGVWIEGRPQVGWTGGYGGVEVARQEAIAHRNLPLPSVRLP